MKKPKSHGGFSISKLSLMVGKDRQTLVRLLQNTTPVATEGKVRYFTLAQVQATLDHKPNKALKEEKLAQEIRKLRIYNDAKEGRLVDESKEAAWLFGLAKTAGKTLWQKLIVEAPTALARPGEEATCREYLKRVYNSVMSSWREMVKDPELQAMLQEEQK